MECRFRRPGLGGGRGAYGGGGVARDRANGYGVLNGGGCCVERDGTLGDAGAGHARDDGAEVSRVHVFDVGSFEVIAIGQLGTGRGVINFIWIGGHLCDWVYIVRLVKITIRSIYIYNFCVTTQSSYFRRG